jgi:hypothetical protein
MSQTNDIPTCPDCGGILEPDPPGWAMTLDAASASAGRRDDPVRWQCLLCGYQDRGTFAPSMQEIRHGRER